MGTEVRHGGVRFRRGGRDIGRMSGGRARGEKGRDQERSWPRGGEQIGRRAFLGAEWHREAQ